MTKKKTPPDKVKDVPETEDSKNESSEEPTVLDKTEKTEEAEKPEIKEAEKPEIKKLPAKREPGYYVAPGKSISVNRRGNLDEGTKVELDIFGNKESLQRLIEKGVIEEVK
jgi:hypothetical protein